MFLSVSVLWVLLCQEIVFCDIVARQFNENEGSVCYLREGGMQTRGVCRKSCPEQSKSEYTGNVCNAGHTPVLYCCFDKITAQQYPTIHEACLKRRLAEEFNLRGFQEKQKLLDKEDEMEERIKETINVFEKECYTSSLSLEEDERNNYLTQCLSIQRPSKPNRYLRSDMLSKYHKVAGIGFKSSENAIVWACSGNFVHASYVLTAASCMRSSGNTPNLVRHSYNYRYESYMKFSDFEVLETFIHPNYDELSSKNDIAILKTSFLENRASNLEVHLIEPIPACLWTKQELPSQRIVVYDHTDKFRSSSSTIIQPTECSSKLGGQLQVDGSSCHNCGFQNKSHIVGSFQYNEDLDLNVPYIVGIGSSKFPCSMDVPALVTHIYPHLEWIESVISKE